MLGGDLRGLRSFSALQRAEIAEIREIADWNARF
jgi:hypothetical protein